MVRAALGTGEVAANAYAAWRSETDLDTLDGGSFRLLPLLYRNLARQGLGGGDIGSRLKGVYRLSWVRNRTALARLEPLIRQLQAAGIAVQLIKGTPLILRYYRDYGVRWMDDCDILVRAGQAQEVMRLLQADGWRADLDVPERIIPAMHAVNFSNAAGEGFDLHWRPLWECCRPEDDGLYWEVTEPGRLGELAVEIPQAAALLLYSCIHGVRWHPTPPFHWIADALTILGNAEQPIDWERFVSLARRLWLTVPAHAALYHLRWRWEADVPDAVLAALRATPVPSTLRLEYLVKLGPVRFWPKALIQWSHARRAVGYPRAGQALLHLPIRMQHLWQLDHLGQVPSRALTAAARRLSGRNRAVQ